MNQERLNKVPNLNTYKIREDRIDHVAMLIISYVNNNRLHHFARITENDLK